MHLSTFLGKPVVDAEEEAFVVFSQDIPSQSLGFIDSQASTLEITVAAYDLTIHQSRGLLTSDRKEGTTGAVVWKVTPLFAQWISSPSNFLFTSLLPSTPSVLELGAGVSGIVALTLSPKVSSYTATDQSYVLKLLRQNIAGNLPVVFPKRARSKAGAAAAAGGGAGEKIKVEELDWENSDTSHMQDVDLIIACDCIYNEALIDPLNQTCAAIAKLRNNKQDDDDDEKKKNPTICLIAQQLRSPDVFEAWLKSFHALFEVWQVPDALLDEGLREGSGFVVHVSIVR